MCSRALVFPSRRHQHSDALSTCSVDPHVQLEADVITICVEFSKAPNWDFFVCLTENKEAFHPPSRSQFAQLHTVPTRSNWSKTRSVIEGSPCYSLNWHKPCLLSFMHLNSLPNISAYAFPSLFRNHSHLITISTFIITYLTEVSSNSCKLERQNGDYTIEQVIPRVCEQGWH